MHTSIRMRYAQCTLIPNAFSFSHFEWFLCSAALFGPFEIYILIGWNCSIPKCLIYFPMLQLWHIEIYLPHKYTPHTPSIYISGSDWSNRTPNSISKYLHLIYFQASNAYTHNPNQVPNISFFFSIKYSSSSCCLCRFTMNFTLCHFHGCECDVRWHFDWHFAICTSITWKYVGMVRSISKRDWSTWWG